MVDLKKLRGAKNLTQLQLAEEVPCARTVIANIECGIAQPSVGTAQRIGHILGFDWWEFFEEGSETSGSDIIHDSGNSQASEN